MAPQWRSANFSVQVPLYYAKAFAAGRLPLEVVRERKFEDTSVACFSRVVFLVLHAPSARLRRLVCCFLSVANHCSGALTCHDHGMFVALCAVKKKICTCMRHGVGQIAVRVHNTPKPNSTVGSRNALRQSKVGCGIDATRILPSIVPGKL